MTSETEMVWIVTKRHADDREVVRGVYSDASSAYKHAERLTCGAGHAEAQAVSVMAHPVYATVQVR